MGVNNCSRSLIPCHYQLVTESILTYARNKRLNPQQQKIEGDFQVSEQLYYLVNGQAKQNNLTNANPDMVAKYKIIIESIVNRTHRQETNSH